VVLSGISFGVLIAAQIISSLGIAIGAQAGLKYETTSILAGVSTGVAAGIAVLMGLGLPKEDCGEAQGAKPCGEDPVHDSTQQSGLGYRCCQGGR